MATTGYPLRNCDEQQGFHIFILFLVGIACAVQLSLYFTCRNCKFPKPRAINDMKHTVILLVLLTAIASCDKVCRHPTVNRLVITNYVDSNCTSVVIKRFDSGSDFTRLVDSSQITVSSATVNFTFADIYDYWYYFIL